MAKNKEPSKTELLARCTQRCEESFARWDELYKNGGSDPFYADGGNLNLVRNQITYCLKEIIELCKELNCALPAVTAREIPPEVDNDYMANKEGILKDAKKALRALLRHSDYKRLLALRGNYSEKELNKIHYTTVVGYVSRLEEAIASSDYLTMRLYRNYARYIEAIESCLRKSAELTPEHVQLSLFDMLSFTS